jgi:hypothetical protein
MGISQSKRFGAKRLCPATFGRRLRAADVPLEPRKVLLGHCNGDITTHYCAPELEELLEAVNKVCEEKSGKSPAKVRHWLCCNKKRLLKQQLIIHSRPRQRAPNLSATDRALLGFWSLFLNPRRIVRSAIIIKPSTLLRFHNALKKQKYRLLYSPLGGRKPGPKGPSAEVINAMLATWMVPLFVECLVKLPPVKAGRHISAQITTRYSNTIDGTSTVVDYFSCQ